MGKIMDIKYGLAATFNSAKDLYEAAGKVRSEGYKEWECYTPIPVHGLDAQMGLGRSNFCLLRRSYWFCTGTHIWFMNSFGIDCWR